MNKIKKGTWGTPSFKGASEQERKKQSIKDQKRVREALIIGLARETRDWRSGGGREFQETASC